MPFAIGVPNGITFPRNIGRTQSDSTSDIVGFERASDAEVCVGLPALVCWGGRM